MPADTTATHRNLLFPSIPDGAPAHVFVGEQRGKALTVLAQAIFEQKLSAVMQLIHKDPSLAFEALEMPSSSNLAVTQPVEFPLACLQHGLAPGYLFAISRGFPVDQLLQAETTTLLQSALRAMSKRDSDSDVALLLSMGARLDAMPSKQAIYDVMAAAFPRDKARPIPGVVNMLIDAKPDFAYPNEFDCPIKVVVSAAGWTNADTAASLARTMAKLVKAGADPGLRSGSPRLTPVEKALGSGNSAALVALIRIGAPTGPDALQGRDLLDVMSKSDLLREALPLVQSALMEAHIAKSDRKASDGAADVPAVAAPSIPARDARRQRIGSI